MKLFKRSEETEENRTITNSFEMPNEERFKSINVPQNRFGKKAVNEDVRSFGLQKASSQISFPSNIDFLRETSLIYQEGEYRLITLLQELSKLGDQEDFLVIMDRWGTALANDIFQSCETCSSEKNFHAVISYLNQIFIYKGIGVFQCSLIESEKTLIISYYFSKFDKLLLTYFGESSSVTLYGAFFKHLMTNIAETMFEIKSIDASHDFWRFTLKA